MARRVKMPGMRTGQHVDNIISFIICRSHFQKSVRCEEGREKVVLGCRKYFGVDCPDTQRWLTLPTRASSLLSIRTSAQLALKMLRSCLHSASSSVSLLRLFHRSICRGRIIPPRSLSLGIKSVGALHSSAMAATSEHAEGPKNKLALSSSPYLQQHATNPVRILLSQ